LPRRAWCTCAPRRRCRAPGRRACSAAAHARRLRLSRRALTLNLTLTLTLCCSGGGCVRPAESGLVACRRGLGEADALSLLGLLLQTCLTARLVRGKVPS